MEPGADQEARDTGRDSPQNQPQTDRLADRPEPARSEELRIQLAAPAETEESNSEKGKPHGADETLVLKMSDGRTVSCQLVCDGTEKYLKEVGPSIKTGEAHQGEPKMGPGGESKPSSFSRSSQFVSSVNSMLEENTSGKESSDSSKGESYKRTTLELFEPIPSKLLKKQPQPPQWTEQGRRLANFVEDSIYRSLKSNDAEVVKEWQLKMNRQAFQEGMIQDGCGSKEGEPCGSGADRETESRDDQLSHGPHQHPCPIGGEASDMASQAAALSQSTAKNGKVSLLDVLREKLRRTLLNYDQQVRQDSNSATRSIDTLFFSPAVESTTPDSQSAMPSSSDDVFGVEEPAYTYCDADSGNNSTDESCSDRPSSTQSAFPASSSKTEHTGFPEGDRGSHEGALDLSCGSQKGKDGNLVKRKSTSDFSLERILARPDPKPKPKHNPFMQTFSDLLDLPPREIKNREPFKVKRRPYRRRRDIGQCEKEEGDGPGAEPETSRVPAQAPIGYLAITEDEYQRSLASSTTGGSEADWPSVALLMNVYSEWKLKNRGITPGSHLSSELGHGLSFPGLPPGVIKASSSPSSVSPPPAQGETDSRSHHRSSCSSDCSSRSAGQVYSKKSRLLQNIDRSCSCKGHHSSRKSSPSAAEDAARSTIRSLLNEEMIERKRGRPAEMPLTREEPDSLEGGGRVKRPRAAYEEEVQLRRDPDAQGVCVIS